MKAIRRSLKGDHKPGHHSTSSIAHKKESLIHKSELAVRPPKKVIKALYDYEPEPGHSQELAFSKGDFFYVVSREDDPDWYEACNTLNEARGLVPVSYFETVGKNERDSGGSVDAHKQKLHDSGFSDRTSPAHPDTVNSAKFGAGARMSAMGKGAMVYGVVQYDFQAERPDELDAKAGEAIIVIAQSNPEWFVAKPIGRLGGPGLIPVSFIELRDMTTGQAVTDPLEAVRKAGVPKVEEWKKMTAEYKNSSITLGKLDSTSSPNVQSVTTGMRKMSVTPDTPGHANGHHNGHHDSGYGAVAQPPQFREPSYQPPLLAPVQASIPRYCFDNDKYWYIIEVKMEDGRWWELSRYYNDFYDFQIALLTQFEEEAGNTGKPRILPFMPGPVTHVTDAISNGRRQNLDEYVKKLLLLPPHISRCQLVRQLFAPRPGDFEIDPNALGDDYRHSGASQQSSVQDASRTVSRQSSHGQINGGAGAYPGVGNRVSHQRSQASMSQANGTSQSRLDIQAQSMNRQPSSLTQASASSNTGAMKIKVFYQDDLIAVRVPSDVNFQGLKEKLQDRLKVNDDLIIQYKDDASGSYVELISDNDLDTALQRNPKLTLVVNVA
ncbi:bud emergence protein 1 [Paecilomyces lecythidis]|uniref:Bud emergence protein 1 n=1 Tax=Paecilomyces lecythidis TaxID=3004212 RepID=A0ABR3YAL9_9EURO